MKGNGFDNHITRCVDQCFTPETFVYTGNGPVRIADVKENTEVITRDGSTQLVAARVEHDVVDTPVLFVTLAHRPLPVVVTRDHRVLSVRTHGAVFREDEVARRLDTGDMRAEMTAAGELRVSDYVCFPLPTDTVDELHWEYFTDDNMRMWAYMLLGGILVGAGGGRAESVLTVPLTCDDSGKVLRFAEEYLRLARVATKRRSVARENGRQREELVWVSGTRGNPYKYPTGVSRAGRVNGRWRDVDRILYSAPKNLIEVFFTGLAEISGSQVLGGYMILLPPVPGLADALCHLALLQGKRAWWFYDDDTQSTTTLVVGPEMNTTEASGPFVHGDMIYVRVKSIIHEVYTGKLYDLEIKEAHTYVTALGAVHTGCGNHKAPFTV